jgi:hypothetical protein
MASQFPNDRPTMTPPTGPGSAGLVERAKNILLTPKTEWPRIDAEPASAQATFMKWAVPLAAIGPIAQLIGSQLFGWGGFGITYRPPLVSAIVTAVLGYAMALVGVWILTFVIDALAPTFGGTKSRDQAMKAAAYSYTAAWLAGVLQIVPALGVIGALIGLYSFYLLYLGLPVVMKAPADKAVGYTIVTVLVAIVVYFVLAAIVGAITASMLYASSPVRTYSATAPGGTVAVAGLGNVDVGGIEAASKRMEAAANNPPAPVAPQALQALLPASVAGFTRTATESAAGAAGGVGGATAKGTYALGDQQFELSVTDMGAMGALATLGGALNVQANKEDAGGYEKTDTVNGQLVNETWRKDDSRGTFGTTVAGRFMVQADGRAPSVDALKAAVAAVDQGRLAALAR